MRAEAQDLIARDDRDTSETAATWRDPKLWTALAITLALKLALLTLIVGIRPRWTQPLQFDLSTWTDFIKAARSGSIPYRDIPTDAPVLQSTFYWLLAKLTAATNLHSARPVALCSTLISATADAINVALFYRLVRQTQPRSAFRATLLWSLSLTALFLGPLHLDPIIVTLLLVAYRLHLRDRIHALTAVLSITAGFTPFASWLYAAVLAQRAPVQPRRRTIGSLEIFFSIQAALHLPFILAGFPALEALRLFANGILGTPRELIAFPPDTALGIVQLWFGHLGIHNIAGWLATALSLFAVLALARRRPQLPTTIIALAVATMIVRPNAGSSWQLWLYPFLLLVALQAPQTTRAWLLLALVFLDATTVLAQPFTWAPMKRELHALAPAAAVEHGGAWTFVFSMFVLAKLALLASTARTLPALPQPATTREQLLTWPRIDFAAVRVRIAQPSAALWLGAAFIIGQSLMTSSAMLHVPEYSDEVYHGQQVEMLCRGESARREGITMLLGYHIVTAAIATASADCSREDMRKQNVAWGLCATLLVFLILRSTGAQNVTARTLGFHFLPVLFPYHFFVYTDVLAIVLILLALYLGIHKRWAVAGLVASVSIAVRQTNALVVILVALLALVDTRRGDRTQDWLRRLFTKTWTCGLGLLAFAIFVVKNHGIAVGDQGSHPFGFHIGNVAFVLFLLAIIALPVNLERIWRERRQLAAVSFGLALTAVYFAYAYLFKIENVYNTHEPFLRNAIVTWATSNILTKTLFFIPISIGFAALWTTPLIRRAYWVCLPVILLGLLPESLIEQRYAIFPLAIWQLFRRDGSTFAEGLTAATNLALSTWLLQQVASGTWNI